MSVTIIVPDTEGIFDPQDAATFLREHVLVTRKDLRRIERLAKRLGFYAELKALDVKMRELGPDPSWASRVSTVKKRARAKRTAHR